jgi:hypothetical protein
MMMMMLVMVVVVRVVSIDGHLCVIHVCISAENTISYRDTLIRLGNAIGPITHGATGAHDAFGDSRNLLLVASHGHSGQISNSNKIVKCILRRAHIQYVNFLELDIFAAL